MFPISFQDKIKLAQIEITPVSNPISSRRRVSSAALMSTDQNPPREPRMFPRYESCFRYVDSIHHAIKFIGYTNEFEFEL